MLKIVPDDIVRTHKITLYSKFAAGKLVVGDYSVGNPPSWPKPEEFYAPQRQADLAILTSRLQGDFRNIEKIVREIAEGIKNIQERPIAYNTQLHDLGDKKYKLRKQINIVIEVHEDEVIAKFPELEVYGSGNTESEAILGLKEEMIALYIELSATSEKELGRLPKMWRRILKQLISCR